jgi:hypothetical protein
MLRAFVIGCGVVLVLGGLALIVALPKGWPAGAELVVFGVLVLIGTIFERWRYRGRVNRASRTWQATEERFRDPISGELLEVAYDPATGQRDYRPVG